MSEEEKVEVKEESESEETDEEEPRKRNESTDTTETGFEFKVLTLGDSGVGKTSILDRYVHDTFSLVTKSTIGVEFYTKKVKHPKVKHRILLNLWDTAGQEKFQAMVPMYYRGAHAAIIVYDITSGDSFKNVIQKNCDSPLMVLIGNKLDNAETRMVKRSEGVDYAQSRGMLFAETSALSAENISKILDIMTFELYNRQSASSGNVINLVENDESDEGIVVPNSLGKEESGCCSYFQ